MAEKTEMEETPHRRAADRAQTSAALHVPRLVKSREVHADVHGSSALGQFNSRLAVLITNSVGTMWAAYLFVIIGLRVSRSCRLSQWTRQPLENSGRRHAELLHSKIEATRTGDK